MFKFKQFGVAAALVLSATGAMASNFRASDQVYIPAAGHLTGSSGTFISDVFISNVDKDPVDVSVIFSQGQNGAQQRFDNIIHLAAGERRELVDFIATPQSQGGLGLSGNQFGQLVFNACLMGANCGADTQDSEGFSPNFRNISVESRIYSIPLGKTLADKPPTTGQLFNGYAWYSFTSSEQAINGLDKVFITGFRATGAVNEAGTYRSNLGLVNASQFSTTTLIARLFSGSAPTTQIGNPYQVTLGPLGQQQLSLQQAFSGLAAGPNATNLFVTVEQSNNMPTNDQPNTCKPNGCPAFFAYGSILDNLSGDATTLEPQFLQPLSSTALLAIYPSGSGKATMHRAARH